MRLVKKERNEEAYQYASKHSEISLDKLLRYGASPSIFKNICWQNGYFVEQESLQNKRFDRRSTIFYLVKREEKRYIAGGVEVAACYVPKFMFRTSSGEYKCLHYKQCQCYLNGNCKIGGKDGYI